MPRPSKQTDQLLIQAARKMYPETGCSKLSLREVAAEAGVNLGMFHYHFKTKNEFVRQVLQEFYEEFFKNFNLDSTQGKTPVEKLKIVLFQVGKFIRNNRQFMLALVTDLMNREEVPLKFVRENVFRHLAVIRGLVIEGQEQGLLRPMPVSQVISFIVGGIMMPIIMAIHFPKIPGVPEAKTVEVDILTDEAIQERIEIALRGLTTPQHKGSPL